jgi:uncharacterized tellurite resistance protein B-like protein
VLAEIGVALSHVDGDIDPREIAMTVLALEDLGVKPEAAEAAIDAAIAKIESGADVDLLLASACAAVPSKARPSVFEACAHILMGDGVLSDAEVLRLAAVKSLLGLDDALAFKIVASAAISAAASDDGLEIA